MKPEEEEEEEVVVERRLETIVPIVDVSTMASLLEGQGEWIVAVYIHVS